MINASGCATRKYTNKQVNFELLYQELSDYFMGAMQCASVQKMAINSDTAIVADGCIVYMQGDPDNCIIRVHMPVDTSDVKLDVGGAMANAVGEMITSKILVGRSFGKIKAYHSLKDAAMDNEHMVNRMIAEGKNVENQVANFIDNFVTNSAQKPPAQFVAIDDIPTQIKKLSELRDLGILTADEFEAKKAELLKRL